MKALLATIAGLMCLPTAGFAQSVEVSFTTTEAGGNYAPRNIVAVWVEDDAGNFVSTIGRWAGTRIDHLVDWTDSSGQDADAVSGATRSNHNEAIAVSWDLQDRNGMAVPNGAYVIRMELADRNSSSADQNNQGSFPIVVDGQPISETASGGGFEGVTIEYSGIDSGLCDNGNVDENETCDPATECPTACEPATEQCVANTLVGSADSCTAECVERLIETCAHSDGCCPAGCGAGEDDDCGDGMNNAGSPSITGGCSSAGGASNGAPVVLILVFGLLAWRRRSGD